MRFRKVVDKLAGRNNLPGYNGQRLPQGAASVRQSYTGQRLPNTIAKAPRSDGLLKQNGVNTGAIRNADLPNVLYGQSDAPSIRRVRSGDLPDGVYGVSTGSIKHSAFRNGKLPSTYLGKNRKKL